MPFSSNLYEKCPFFKIYTTCDYFLFNSILCINCKVKITYFFDKKKMWKKKCNGKKESKDVGK